MPLNYKKIEKRMEELKFSKVDVCRKANLSRTTFDGLLAGRDSKISTIEDVAAVLHSPVGYFFDEDYEPLNIQAFNDSLNIGSSFNIGDINALIKENAQLHERVKELKEHIEDLKDRIEELKTK